MSIDGYLEQWPHMPEALAPGLAATLRLLRDTPPGAAESTLALLPRESRSELTANGILEARPVRGAEWLDINITPYGWRLISSG
jgi:hypothetical protein